MRRIIMRLNLAIGLPSCFLSRAHALHLLIVHSWGLSDSP